MSAAEVAVRGRPPALPSRTFKMPTGCAPIFVIVTFDEKGEPFEVFAKMGKSGGCVYGLLESLCRMVSLALRAGVNPRKVCENLRGISCPSPTWADGKQILSCPDAIASGLAAVLEGLGA